MTLLFLWIDDGDRFSKLGCNFTSAHRFEVEIADDAYTLSHESPEDAVPETFFDLPNGKGEDRKEEGSGRRVSAVSVIVGENAVGKTSVARFIRELRLNPDATAPFKYVLVYEVDKTWHVQWWLGDEASDCNRDLKRIGHWPSGVKICECAAGQACQRNSAFGDFEFAYYTPHFTTENPFPANCLEMENLSTWGIMYGGFEEQIGRPYDVADHVAIRRNYLATERRMGLKVWRQIPPDLLCEGLPKPRGVRIAVHQVELTENVKWLDMQRVRLERIRDESAQRQNRKSEFGIQLDMLDMVDYKARVEWAASRLAVLRGFQSIGKHATSKIGKCFVLQAFAAFVLEWGRISDMFGENSEELYVSYAEKLKDIFLDVDKPSCDSSRVSCKEVSSQIAEELRNVINGLSKTAVDPQWVPEQEAAIMLFVQLGEWCQRTENDRQDQKCALYDVLVDMQSSNELAKFFDAYELAIGRNDFLSFQYDPLLAAGDMCFLSMYARLYDYFVRNEKCRESKRQAAEVGAPDILSRPLGKWNRSFSNEMLVFFDEAETAFHPKRQREIILNLLKFFNWLKMDVRAHLVFATHSPILLSDVPDGNVIKLRRTNRNDRGEIEVVKTKAANTFASNIFDLYKDSFFLGNTMGTFAAEKVNALLRKLNPDPEDMSDEEYQQMLMQIKDKLTTEDVQIAKLIGDPFLSRYVWRRLEELSQIGDVPEDEKAVNGGGTRP